MIEYPSFAEYMIFRVCSGQSRRPGARQWGICLDDPFYGFMPWWRAKTANGVTRTFHTRVEAEKVRRKLEAQGFPADLIAEADRCRKLRARDPAEVRVVPYNGYLSTGCIGCINENRFTLKGV